jgi:hypothetical protein
VLLVGDEFMGANELQVLFMSQNESNLRFCVVEKKTGNGFSITKCNNLVPLAPLAC